MIKEHDVVVLTQDLPEDSLKAGDVGTVVHMHQGGADYEVEFMTLAGRTIAVTTVMASQVRAVTSRDVVHVRELQPMWTRSASRKLPVDANRKLIEVFERKIQAKLAEIWRQDESATG